MNEKEQAVRGVFVIGRQHSGNTFLTRILGSAPDFFVDENENSWFEFVPVIKQKKTLEERIACSTEHLLRGKPEVAASYLKSIEGWAQQNPEHTLYELFQESMNQVTHGAGKQYWALKATSYIFYASEILRNCPNVKLIYILRNPLDLTASSKKRNQNRMDWFIATNIAWKKGVSIAEQLLAAFPDRFLVVKYENLVQGASEFNRISKFLGVELQEDYSNMPVVNTSDQPYAVTQEKGLKQSRVYYFRKYLSDGQIYWATKLSGGKKIVKKYYPNIPLPKNVTLFNKIGGIQTFVLMACLFARKHFNIFSVHQLRRVQRRLKLMLFSRENA
ncbi:MAG: sulfotransferase [Bacteroidota bacterium]